MVKGKKVWDFYHYKEVFNKGGVRVDKKYKEYRRRWNDNPRNNIVGKFPIHLDLEAATGCNLKCPFCFQSYDPPKPTFLKFDYFKKAINEGIPLGLCSIKLQYRGEALLHPQLTQMVRYAKERGVLEVMFNTNATLLTEKKARELISGGLDKLICSVDGYVKEHYEKNRVGAKFEVVLENIKRIQRLKKEMGINKPMVRVQMLDTPMNHPFIPGYISFWSNIVDQVAIEGVCDYHKKVGKKVVVDKDFVCEQLWQRLFVLANGNITLCCGDHYERMVLGHISKDSLGKIWTSERLKRIRDLHRKGESHKVPICALCDFRERIIYDNKKGRDLSKEELVAYVNEGLIKPKEVVMRG